MTDTNPAPTLHDVAAKAGVSTATVSRSLNFPDKVSQATRDKVNAAIATLGYAPNFGARAMAARRTHTIGAIIPTMENAIFARGLQAFQEELRQTGYTMLVASSSYQPAIEAEQVRKLVGRGADALLLIGHDRPADTYAFLSAQNVPALVTWAYAPDTCVPSVGFDNSAAMRQMAEAVIAQGHKRLALITAPTKGNDRATARLAGIKAAMTAAGHDPDTLLVAQTQYSIDNGASAFSDFMTHGNPPTAVLCGNDVLAVGALRQAHEMHIKVPEAISIVGFDDIELAQVAYPALTTVHVPHAEMGRMAARTLVEMLQTGARPQPIRLATHVVHRATLGPAP